MADALPAELDALDLGYGDGDENPFANIEMCAKIWETELEETPTAAKLSPDGSLIAVGTVESEITVIDTATGETKTTLSGHKGGTNAIQFISDSTLASCGEDGKLKLWNLLDGSLIAEFSFDFEDADKSSFGTSITHLAITSDKSYIALGAGRTIIGISFPDGYDKPPRVRVYPHLDSTVECLRFNRSGDMFASYNGGVIMWDMSRSEDDLQELPLPYDGACLCVDANPSGDWIVTGCHDATVHIYHLAETPDKKGVQLEEFTCGGYDGKVKLVDFNYTGKILASSGGLSCTLWDFNSTPAGSTPTLTAGHRGNITCQQWLEDGVHLVTGGRDGKVLLYDTRQYVAGMPNFCLPGLDASTDGDEVTTLNAIDDKDLIIVGHLSGMVRAWKLPICDEEEEQG